MRTACIFAHYDRKGEVEDYVLYYLRELQKLVDHLLFVTTASLSEPAVSVLNATGVKVLQRENVGYDFFSYKAGIETLELTEFDELVLCNDSVYGPFFELDTIFEEMRARGAGFWGLTDSYDYSRHLQSYFLVFGNDALHSVTFEQFWSSVEALSDKVEIIRRYEVGLSKAFAESGVVLEALAPAENVGTLHRIVNSPLYYVATFLKRFTQLDFWTDSYRVLSGKWRVGKNTTHMNWRWLIQEGGVPFVKVALLRDNPKRVQDLEDILDVVQSLGGYPTDVITGHLERVASK